ncbi:MAG: DUF3313 family protein, partial [Gammaproteobacteria bacterium]|nr:DUF3313 family protein [Gammaproteobacteria bacterium]
VLFPLDAESRRIQVDTDAEPTFDGLYPVSRGNRMQRVWVKPDLDLEPYTKILPHGEGVSFRDVPERPRSSSANEFPVDAAMQERLPEMARDIFREELERSERYEITDEPGPGVLMIRGTLIDVVSFVPPDTVGRRRVLLRSIGEATLVLELRDSETNEVLARAADRRGGDRGGTGVEIRQRADARSEVRRVLRDWARQLRRRLDSFTAL